MPFLLLFLKQTIRLSDTIIQGLDEKQQAYKIHRSTECKSFKTNTKLTKKQAQHRAAAETAAFIRVVRYNDESSFNLDNDFDMNPVSPKTWPHMGPIWITI